MKLGILDHAADGLPLYRLEVSDAAGKSWRAVSANALPQMRMDDYFRLFMVDDESFVSGQLPAVNTGGGPSGSWFFVR